jgi:hypothetical protein
MLRPEQLKYDTIEHTDSYNSPAGRHGAGFPSSGDANPDGCNTRPSRTRILTTLNPEGIAE